MEISNLLQSNKWEEFQRNFGNETLRIGEYLFIKQRLPLGKTYLYCPQGPEIVTQDFAENIRKTANHLGSIFIRIEPRKPIENIKIRRRKTKSIQPPDTLLLDITPNEETLLANMKQKTRYNINLAMKKGVTIETTTNPKNISVFYGILKQTTDRDGFRGHSKRYYEKFFESLGEDETAVLYLARYNNKYIGANIITFYGNLAAYVHGSSSNEYRNAMAPYLLQWQAILDAKKRGMEYYDFRGIAPNDSPRHPWAGVTKFKKGFGGEEIHYPGTYDVIMKPFWYRMYRIFRSLNRLVPKR